jgi:hypothetical protein
MARKVQSLTDTQIKKPNNQIKMGLLKIVLYRMEKVYIYLLKKTIQNYGNLYIKVQLKTKEENNIWNLSTNKISNS